MTSVSETMRWYVWGVSEAGLSEAVAVAMAEVLVLKLAQGSVRALLGCLGWRELTR